MRDAVAVADRRVFLWTREGARQIAGSARQQFAAGTTGRNALRRYPANEAYQEQQNDGANRGANDLTDDPRKLQVARQ